MLCPNRGLVYLTPKGLKRWRLNGMIKELISSEVVAELDLTISPELVNFFSSMAHHN